MPSASNIVIADSVPVNRTYVPQQVGNGEATLVDKTTSSIIGGQSTLVLTFSPISSKRKTDRTGVRLNLPKVSSLGGVDSVDSTARFIGDFVVPETWTVLERNNFATLAGNAVKHALIQGYVKDRDPLY